MRIGCIAERLARGTGVAVSAGSGCAADHRQDLVFAGALTGHLNCDTGQPICDFVYAGKKTDKAFSGAIHGNAAGKSLLLSLSVAAFSGPGTYRSDNQEGGPSIVIDGPSHWVGHLQDQIVVATASEHTLNDSFDSTLSADTSNVRLTGTWCATA